jgi:hypothetical protein
MTFSNNELIFEDIRISFNLSCIFIDNNSLLLLLLLIMLRLTSDCYFNFLQLSRFQ